MTTTIRCSVTALAVAALVSLASFLAPAAARAACPTITITSNLPCTVDITFFNPTAAFPYTITGVTPGTAVYPGPPFTPTGILTALGNLVGPGAACSGCVVLHETSMSTNCCAHICPNGPCALLLTQVLPCPGTCQ